MHCVVSFSKASARLHMGNLKLIAVALDQGYWPQHIKSRNQIISASASYPASMSSSLSSY